MKKLHVKHWQYPVVALLGAWFAASPWVLQLQATRSVMGAIVVLGLALLASAVAAMIKPDTGEKWTTAAIALVTAVAPWLVRFAGDPVATRNAEAVGLISLLLALWVLVREGDFDGWTRDLLAR